VSENRQQGGKWNNENDGSAVVSVSFSSGSPHTLKNANQRKHGDSVCRKVGSGTTHSYKCKVQFHKISRGHSAVNNGFSPCRQQQLPWRSGPCRPLPGTRTAANTREQTQVNTEEMGDRSSSSDLPFCPCRSFHPTGGPTHGRCP
jgi:hypothetical protein